MRKKARYSAPPWSDLQPELLWLVLLRLPSLIDRVRLRAVCRSWRSDARTQPLPSPLPWLSLHDGTSLSIPDGRIIRMPPAPDGAFCCGAIDSSLFFVHRDGGCSLVNPFSKATLDLPEVSMEWFVRRMYDSSFRKIVVSSPGLGPEPPSSSSSQGSLVVALILGGGVTLRMCRAPIGASSSSLTTSWWCYLLDDIAFFNGKLYGVRDGRVLSTFELNNGGGLNGEEPDISRVECITDLPIEEVNLSEPLRTKSHRIKSYLVECRGRLLLVNRMIFYNLRTMKYGYTEEFEVFEAELSTEPADGGGQWRRLFNLGGHQALFVGRHGSKSVPAGGCTGVREDCIYFMCDYRDHPVDPLRDSGVYNMRNGTFTPLLPKTKAKLKYRRRDPQWRPTWLFPADADAMIMESN